MRALIALAALSALPVYADTGSSGTVSMCIKRFSLIDLNPLDNIRAAFRVSDDGPFNTDYTGPAFNAEARYDTLGTISGMRVSARTVLGDGGESFYTWTGPMVWNPGESPFRPDNTSILLAPRTAFQATAIGRLSLSASGSGYAGGSVHFGDTVFGNTITSGTWNESREMTVTYTNDTDDWMAVFPGFSTYLEMNAPGAN